MKGSFRKKTLAVIIICLMMLMPLPAVMGSNEYFVENLDGNILYVGGNGPGNYTTIQDAIDAASDGDTVYVYSGIYHENIKLDKSIVLQGEDKTLTIIDGDNQGDTIEVTAGHVTILDFNIQNASYMGIEIRSCYNIIENNIIQNNEEMGILLFDEYEWYKSVSIWRPGPSHNVIRGNIIKNNGNKRSGHGEGISIWGGVIIYTPPHDDTAHFIPLYSKNNIIKNNIIKDQYSGIILTKETAKTVIELNQFENNDISVEPIHSKFNVITKNNFLGSDPFFRSGINEWNENYWGQPLDKPKKIEGRIFGLIPWYNYDEHPAQEPYIVGGE